MSQRAVEPDPVEPVQAELMAHAHPDAFSAGKLEDALDPFLAWLDAGHEPHTYPWEEQAEAAAAAAP